VITKLHGVTAQKTVLFIITVVRTSNPRRKNILWCILSVDCLTILFQYREYTETCGGITDERLIGKDLGGSSFCLIEVLSRHLLGRAEENHEERRSR
jgi:hypothetical protein